MYAPVPLSRRLSNRDIPHWPPLKNAHIKQTICDQLDGTCIEQGTLTLINGISEQIARRIRRAEVRTVRVVVHVRRNTQRGGGGRENGVLAAVRGVRHAGRGGRRAVDAVVHFDAARQERATAGGGHLGERGHGGAVQHARARDVVEQIARARGGAEFGASGKAVHHIGIAD